MNITTQQEQLTTELAELVKIAQEAKQKARQAADYTAGEADSVTLVAEDLKVAADKAINKIREAETAAARHASEARSAAETAELVAKAISRILTTLVQLPQ